MAIETGTRLSHYEITGKLGAGGMGEVSYSWADDGSVSSLELTLSPLSGERDGVRGPAIRNRQSL